ncbi:NAD(P)-dependent oxidoreductase [Aeromicrobium sp. Sec7.5]|uniref:NAD(P)-dependent oxidoreductase n=1 Tax=Aeromicrobium sp. Sec7.5 TaxID=3121276 RepID=UPI002FE46972
MRISVLGATGMVGREVVAEALSRGHAVTAVSRRPTDLALRGRLAVQRRDLTDRSTWIELSDVDVAVLTVRLAAGDEELLGPLTGRVLDAAASSGTRVVVVGGAAPLLSPHGADLLVADDPAFVPEAWRAVAAASLAQLEACRRHAYEAWTYVSPPAHLEPGPRTGL